MTGENKVIIKMVDPEKLGQEERKKLVDEIISLNRQYQKIMRLHLDVSKSHVETGEIDKYYYDMALDDLNNLFIVAKTGENSPIIGYAYSEICHKHDDLISPPFIIVNEIAIDDHYHKNELKQALIAKIEETAKIKKIKQMVIDVHEFNKESLEIYETSGFKTLVRKMIKTI